MKTRTLLFTLTAIFCCLSFIKVSGQTIAVGHISAEVVEAVGATSFASNDIELNYSKTQSDDNSFETTAMVAENVSLGSIHISSGLGVACNLTVKPATLVDEKGNDFSLEPIASFSGRLDSQRVDGPQNIELAGKAMLDSHQASGLYRGSYTLVFSYN